MQSLLLLLYGIGIGFLFHSSWSADSPLTRLSNICIAIAMPALFYANTYWLIPHYLKPRKWLVYIVALLGLIGALTLSQSILLASITPRPGQSFATALRYFILQEDLISGPITLSLIFSFGYRFTRDWLVNLTLIERLNAEKSTAELAFLKTQIQPHFLFNTLNNLYALALEEGSQDTADGIARLGALMRYSLHDAHADTIPLTKELDCIQQYIDLQRLRMLSTQVLQVDFPDLTETPSTDSIAPMLLLPFIENAFKHGTSPTRSTWVRIHISIKQSMLKLTVENRMIPQNASQPPSGIGLKNVQNRLEVLYPDRHMLDIQQNDDSYRVRLELHLAE